MISEKPQKPSTSRSQCAKPLKRGTACVICRCLKTKCDGIRPVCGRCALHAKDDCEYTDERTQSRTQALQETIYRLQARIRDLENPEFMTPSIMLHDPHNSAVPQFMPSTLESTTFDNLSELPDPNALSRVLPDDYRYKSEQIWPLPFECTELDATCDYSPISTPLSSIFGSVSPSSSSTSAKSEAAFLGVEEPPLLVIQNLLETFLTHSSQLGFFLHLPRFTQSALLPLPFGHYSRPSPALLSTVYLWGVHLSKSQPLLLYEHIFLSRASQHTAEALLNAGAFPRQHHILQIIQAEVLLATYFFRNGRFLEARYHATGAVSMAISSGLHKIRSSPSTSSATIAVWENTEGPIPAPQDDIEEGERINGFWTACSLLKNLAVTLDPLRNPCVVFEGFGIDHIDTPWPLDIEGYEAGLLSPFIQGISTVRNFLLDSTGTSDNNGTSLIALNVKGSILLHQAALLAERWTTYMEQHEFDAFFETYTSLGNLLDKFRATLPPILRFDSTTGAATGTLVVIHALAHAATIKLHDNFASTDPGSRQKCVAAAQAIVSLVGDTDPPGVSCFNPIVGTLWMIACQAFISEIFRVRDLRDVSVIGEEELLTGLKRGLITMSIFAVDSSMIRYQLSTVQEAFESL